MDPMDIRIWNAKVDLLERTEALIEAKTKTDDRETVFYEGLALFLAQGYVGDQPAEQVYGLLSQRAA
jgi:hypothetical protein